MLVVLDHLGLHGPCQGEDLAEVVEEGDDLVQESGQAGDQRLVGGRRQEPLAGPQREMRWSHNRDAGGVGWGSSNS